MSKPGKTQDIVVLLSVTHKILYVGVLACGYLGNTYVIPQNLRRQGPGNADFTPKMRGGGEEARNQVYMSRIFQVGTRLNLNYNNKGGVLCALKKVCLHP